MILIIGATGTVGRSAVSALRERGAALRALTRDADKARALPGWENLQLAIGETTRPESLDAALVGVTRVLLVSPMAHGWEIGEQNLIAAAVVAGVKQVVKISASGAVPDHASQIMASHAVAEQQLAESGLGYTILRGNSFMQNFLGYIPMIKGAGAIFQCTGDAPMAMIDTRDLGEVAAAVLAADSKEHHGKIYDVSGPQALTYSDAASKLAAASGRAIRYQDMPGEAFEQMLVGFGVPAWAAKGLVNIYATGYYRDGRAAEVSPTVQAILGRPGRSFDDFARDFASAFQ